MTYYTIGMLREQRAILYELIAETYAAILDEREVDLHYWNELWVQLEKLDWIMEKRMALVV